jgi:hypothetical protein
LHSQHIRQSMAVECCGRTPGSGQLPLAYPAGMKCSVTSEIWSLVCLEANYGFKVGLQDPEPQVRDCIC